MPECPTCNRYVTADYVRVFGDNDGEIDSCPNCQGTETRRRTTTDTSDRTVYLHDVLDQSAGTDSNDATDREEPADERTGIRARMAAVSGLLGR